MTKSTILHIGTKKEVLTKRQKEFNRLTKKIEQLDKQLIEFRNGMEQLQQRSMKEMKPLYDQMNSIQAETVRRMDQIYPDKLLKKNDQKKLSYLITDLSFDLTGNGYEDLKPIFDKHNEVDYDTVNAEIDLGASDIAKGMASHFGIHFDEDEDISTADKFQEQMFKKLLEREEEFEEEQRIKDAKNASRPKSQKQIDREEKQKNEEQRLTKSVRSVYMDLVKAFHPDRERDESEKIRKTELMQRVTQAYNDNNLMALLKLQMEFDRIDQEHLEKLADEQLLYYNKVLKQQADDLEHEKFDIIQELASLTNMYPFEITSIETVAIKFNSDVRDFKKELKKTKSEIELWNDALKVKAFLKTYKIPKEDDFDLFF